MSDNTDREPEENPLAKERLKRLKDFHDECVGHETEEQKSEKAKRLGAAYESWRKNPITLQEIRDKGYLNAPKRP